MPLFGRKPTLDDQVLDLKMSSRTLNMQYNKCMKDSVLYEKKMKAEVAKGNQEGARIYAESAVRMKQQGKQFMVMSSRVEAAAMTMQSMASMSNISKTLSSSVAAISSASKSLDMTRMYSVMDNFKVACEDNNVMMAGFDSAMSGNSVENTEDADSLLQKAQLEIAAVNGETMGVAPVGQVQTSQPAGSQLTSTSALMNRLNGL